MLHGRDHELRRVDDLLGAAGEGQGGALLLLGDAGSGKSALAAAAMDRAAERGMDVRSACAVQAERDVPMAALGALLGPAAATGRTSLPKRLQALAAQRPLLIVVDDVQWLDEPSLDALAFAARRLEAARVALLFAGRPRPDRDLRARGLEVLDLPGLDDGDARRLLGDDLAPEPRRLVVEAACGNPLALVELAGALTADQRSGVAAVPVPLRAGAAADRLFGAELDALPAAAPGALLVLAAEEDLGHGDRDAVLAALGLDGGALGAAQDAGVVHEASGRLRFRHPLLRSLVYHRAPAADRAAAHAALAVQLTDTRGARHLAAAATRADEAVAVALETAAEDAWGDGALADAAETFAHAAALTPAACADARARRTLSAARLLAVADQPRRALALAEREQVATPACGPSLRAALQHVRGAVRMRVGDLDGGAQILIGEAERVAGVDPARAAEMLLDASLRSRAAGDYSTMVRLTRRTRHLAARQDPPLAALGEVTEAIALLHRGDGAEAEAMIARHEDLLLDPLALRFGLEVLGSAAHTSVWLERFDRAADLLGTLITRARDRDAATALVYPLAVRAQLRLRRGRLQAALADGQEAVRLASETHQHGLVAFATAMLCEVEAALGLEDACREHAAATIALCDTVGGDAASLWGRAALGQLELTLGRPDAAVGHLDACARVADRVGLVEPNVVQWPANLVEALVRSGRADEAREHLPRLQEGCGTAWARGAHERSAGLLAEGDEGERLLEASVATFEAAGARFEAARSQLALGERRRRGRQRRSSRTPLTAALGAFQAAGAEPWAARAHEELRAGGLGTTAAPAAAAWDELTPHELRVARLVAGGRTNPEVAAQLFVTRKTVEHHLSQVYRKLGIRSRIELARLLSTES